jgi:hypothetical protein
MVVRDEHARFDTSHYPAWGLVYFGSVVSLQYAFRILTGH